MSIKQCAGIKNRIFVLIISAILFSPVNAQELQSEAGEQAPAEFPSKIVLNSIDWGEYFVFAADDDFLVKADDLRGMGIIKLEGEFTVIDEEEYISLKSMTGADFTFDEANIAIDITADPHLFEKNTLIMRTIRRPDVVFTKENSALLNYNFTFMENAVTGTDEFTLDNELDLRWKNALFLTGSSYKKTPEDEKFVRLMSNITFDKREELKRFVIGDFFGLSGELGSTLNMGGISYSKNYDIDPYFVRYPETGFSGLLTLPSEIEIYRDGVIINRQTLPPGEFDLTNIPLHSGSGMLDIIIRDPYGREQKITQPYYFTDILLKKGLQEFSYNLGFLREEYDQKSNNYSNLMFLGFHRIGASDIFSPGIRAEAKKGLTNAGVFSTLLVKPLGVIDTSFSLSSSDKRGDGVAGSARYSYRGTHLSANLQLKGFSRDYSNLSTESLDDSTKYELSAGAAYVIPKLGAFSLNYSESETHLGIESEKLFGVYSKNITGRSNLHMTVQHDLVADITEFFAGFQYYFKQGLTGSVSYKTEDSRSEQRVQVLKNLPLGQGLGYRAYYEKKDTGTDNIDYYNTRAMYNAKYGRYTGEINGIDSEVGYSLSAAGSLSYVRNSFNLSRPVQDSFALVKAGELKGVRTYLSNQRIGITDSSGEILIPDLNSYYDNQISINDKDIPIDYSIPEVTKFISPPLKSGAYVEFEPVKFQAVTGMLHVKAGGEERPVEYYEVSLLVDGQTVSFPTASQGEFYLENISPGKYRAEFTYEERPCEFDIIIPKSDEMILELGTVLCEVHPVRKP